MNPASRAPARRPFPRRMRWHSCSGCGIRLRCRCPVRQAARWRRPKSPPAGAGAPAQSAAPNAMPGMMPGMLPFPNPAAMFAALDPVEVERRIGELKVIENWLRMSLDVIQMSIRTLELQHASLEAMHAGRAPSKGKATGSRASADPRPCSSDRRPKVSAVRCAATRKKRLTRRLASHRARRARLPSRLCAPTDSRYRAGRSQARRPRAGVRRDGTRGRRRLLRVHGASSTH